MATSVIVVGVGRADERWAVNASAVNYRDADWAAAEDAGLLGLLQAKGGCDRDGRPMRDGYICVAAVDDEEILNEDKSVVAFREAPRTK